MSEIFDLHQQITDQIIRALETTKDDFVMPWHRAAATGHPVNATSRRRYNGINAISLWVAAMNVGYAPRNGPHSSNGAIPGRQSARARGPR